MYLKTLNKKIIIFLLFILNILFLFNTFFINENKKSVSCYKNNSKIENNPKIKNIHGIADWKDLPKYYEYVYFTQYDRLDFVIEFDLNGFTKDNFDIYFTADQSNYNSTDEKNIKSETLNIKTDDISEDNIYICSFGTFAPLLKFNNFVFFINGVEDISVEYDEGKEALTLPLSFVSDEVKISNITENSFDYSFEFSYTDNHPEIASGFLFLWIGCDVNGQEKKIEQLNLEDIEANKKIEISGTVDGLEQFSEITRFYLYTTQGKNESYKAKPTKIDFNFEPFRTTPTFFPTPNKETFKLNEELTTESTFGFEIIINNENNFSYELIFFSNNKEIYINEFDGSNNNLKITIENLSNNTTYSNFGIEIINDEYSSDIKLDLPGEVTTRTKEAKKNTSLIIIIVIIVILSILSILGLIGLIFWKNKSVKSASSKFGW